MKLNLRWYDALLVAFLVYLFLFQITAIWPFTIDDMYISLRYAKNWSSGAGLLWNSDSPPVEGYSNFSFVVLATLTLLVHGDPVIALKCAGIVGLFFSCVFVYFISRFWFSTRLSLIPVIYLLLYIGELVWAVSGLETTFYQALICGSVFFIFYGLGYRFFPQHRVQISSKHLIIAGIILSLAAMTRPEAPAFIILFFILMCFDNPKVDGRREWRGIIYFCCAIALCFGPYFLWRWYYYGFLFPNTIYCKGFVEHHYSFYLDVKYLLFIWPFALLALPACIKAKDKRHYFLWLPSVVYLLLLINSVPLVAYYNRLFLTSFALLLPLVQQGISTLLELYLPEKDSAYAISLALMSCFFAVMCIPKMTLSEFKYYAQNPILGEHLRWDVVRWLEKNASQNDTVIIGDAGLIPYYSPLKFIDSYCFNNKEMAHDSKTLRYENFCKKTLLEKPQIIVLTSLTDDDGFQYQPSDSCFKKAFKNNKKYRKKATFSIGGDAKNYHYEVYALF